MKRKHEISYMNILLCLGVIMIHALSELVSVPDKTGMVYDCAFVLWRMLSCAVPGFIFLSGLKLSFKEQKQWGRFYIRRFTSVIIPYIIWMPIYFYFSWKLNYYESISTKSFFTMLFDGTATAHFYFITVIAQFYITFPLWQLIVKKLPALPVLIVCAVITAFSNAWLPVILENHGISLPLTNDRMMTNYLLPWVLGCYLGKNYDKIKPSLVSSRILLYALFVILAAFDTYYAKLTVTAGTVHLWLYYINIAYCAIAALAMLAFFSRLADKREPLGFIRCLDRSSYYIYLTHLIVVMFAKDILNNMGTTNILHRFFVTALSAYIITIPVCMAYTLLKSHIKKQTS